MEEPRVVHLFQSALGIGGGFAAIAPVVAADDLRRPMLLMALGVLGSVVGTVLADAIKRAIWSSSDARRAKEGEVAEIKREVAAIRHDLENHERECDPK